MRAFPASILAIAALALANSALAQPHGGDHRYAPPSPQSLGGGFELRDAHGRAVTMSALRGRWTLYYFGYSRCTDTCPIAIPTIAEAARRLRAVQIPTRAVFIDIEPPSGTIRPRNPKLPVTERGHHVEQGEQSPLAALQKRFNGDLLALTGTRAQLNAATVAFQVRREHVPPRPAEEGHSINHTSFIYLAGPDGRIVHYFYHDAAPDTLVQDVRRRQRAS